MIDSRYESIERGYAKVNLTDEENEFDAFWQISCPEATIVRDKGVDRTALLDDLTK